VSAATGVAEPLWIPTPADGRLRQACALIADNLREPLTLRQIGNRIGVSQRTLSRLFHDELGLTSIFVTHDQDEAFALADRVALLNQGKVEQFAPPEQIARNPASEFVRAFVE